MNRIGILTYHTGYNYGASLQAYALQTVINRYIGQCEIINFESQRFLASREMFSHNPKRLKEWIKIIFRLPYKNVLRKRQNMFDDFTTYYLSKSDLYRTEKEVMQHAGDYDCIICGSDQIWNLDQADAPAANLLYYLNFPKRQRRVSYAASFGKWIEKVEQSENLIIPWLKQFDKISVRETSGMNYLQSKGIKCELVLDPTLLLDVEDYDKIAAKRLVKERYLLLFSWNCNRDVIKVAKYIAKEKGLKIINIVPPPRAMGKGIHRKLDVGPCEFLSMIKYADYVVTNSFHGTVFSTIYQKQFVSVVTGEPDTRMASIMEQLLLSSRLIHAKEVRNINISQEDYCNVQNRKSELRKSSFDYLEQALGEKRK